MRMYSTVMSRAKPRMNVRIHPGAAYNYQISTTIRRNLPRLLIHGIYIAVSKYTLICPPFVGAYMHAFIAFEDINFVVASMN